MSETPLTREFLAERDLRIWEMRSSGLSHTDIAKRFDIKLGAVSAALARQAKKLNTQAAYSYPEVIRLELDRLDDLQKTVWPLAHPRRITLDDGSTIVVEPDLKAVETLLKIFADRRKLLGLDVQKVAIDMNQDVRHTLHGADTGQEAIDYESETRALLRHMVESRMLEAGVIDAILAQVEEDNKVIDVAEVEEIAEGVEKGLEDNQEIV